jgi:hypothetical protein
MFLFSLTLSFEKEIVMSVILYTDRDFGGRSQRFEAGVYRADRGELGGVGNDTISSAQVPFGYTVGMHENENNGEGSGMSVGLTFGDHGFLGRFSDRASLVKVYPWTDVYFSTDDEKVPPPLKTFGMKFTSTTDGSNQSVNVLIDYDTDKKYYKKLEYLLPQGVTPKVWESTKNGNAGWEYSLDNGLLRVVVWVNPRDILGAKNWVGVRISL